MESLLIIIIALLTATVAVLIWLITRQHHQGSSSDLLRHISEQQGQQLQQTTHLLLQQLNRHQESQERNTTMVHTRLDHATKVVADVQGKLMQLEEANKRIFDLGKDISSLQRILQAPKLRGGMGEIWLADLISQIIPAEHYKMQYRFKSGEICDAVISLRDGLLLPIDSKFSLENFVRMNEAEEGERDGYRKLFAADIKKRIDEIAKKYILPGESTLDFAFMYVPAENVYYQAFIQDNDLNLQNYAFAKKVIPVSPSSFYAYLQVILFGLRGLAIEQSAKDIQKNLAGLQGEFGKFRESYEKVGVHLRHAQQSFEQTDKRLGKVEEGFTRVTQAEKPLIEATNEAPLILGDE